MNACVNCKHSTEIGFNLRCTKFGRPNLVFGGTIKPLCLDARDREALCGQAGRYFEPIPPPEKRSVLEIIRRIFR